LGGYPNSHPARGRGAGWLRLVLGNGPLLPAPPKGVEPWMALVGTPSQLIDIVGEYDRVGADQLCLDFSGNDPESYELFVQEVMKKV
jgi:hypothetical protein